MKKKILGLTAAALATVTMATTLSSCGGSYWVDNAGEEFKLLSIDDIKGETIEVEFWHSFGQSISAVLTQMVSDFETEIAKEGLDIKINLKAIGGGYDGLRERVNLGTSSGSIPTMLLGYPDHFADYISNDILLPLNELVYAAGDVGLEGVTSTTNDFIASYWTENQLQIKGETKVAGIPFNKSTEIMTYNASVVDPILEANGWLSETGTWDNPTWDQVWAISQYVLDNKNTISWNYNGNYSLRDVTYPVYIDSEANYFITMGRQSGGDGNYTSVDTNGAGTVHVNTTANKTVQEQFVSKASSNLFHFPAKVSQSYGSALMNNLSAVISVGSTAGIKNNNSAKYDLKATGIPQLSYAASDTQAVIQQGTNLAILSANSNNKTRLASWLLIKYLTSTEVTEQFSINTGYMPVRTSALNSDTYQAFLKNTSDPFEGDVSKAMNAAFSQINYFYTDPAFTGSSICRDKLEGLVHNLFIYNKTFASSVSAYNTELKALKINVRD